MSDTTNPYRPPPAVVDAADCWWQKLKRWLLQTVTTTGQPRGAFTQPIDPQRFAGGEVVLHYGVAFFTCPDEPEILYSALPSSEATQQRMDRNVAEVLRVLPDFIVENPQLHRLLRDRRLVVRMIDKYANLDIEIFAHADLGSSVVDTAIDAAIQAAEEED